MRKVGIYVNNITIAIKISVWVKLSAELNFGWKIRWSKFDVEKSGLPYPSAESRHLRQK